MPTLRTQTRTDEREEGIGEAPMIGNKPASDSIYNRPC